MHFLFANFERRFENQLAALKAASLKRVERLTERRALPELVSQYYGVFDGLCGSLTEMWRNGMGCIPDKDDSTAVPGRRHEDRFQRAVHD